MRQIGTISDEASAGTFSDYLLAHGIQNRVDEDGPDRFSIWVLEEGRVQEAFELFDEWQRDPSVAESRAFERMAKAERRKREQRRTAADRSYQKQRRAVYAGSWSIPVTYVLIAASIAVTLLSQFGRDPAVVRWLFIRDPFVRPGPFPGLPGVMHGEVWRLFTPMFIHFGILHIVFDLWWFFDLGGAIESHDGAPKYVPMILSIALVSDLAQYWATGSPAFGGMSGVVYGAFGYIWIKSKLDPRSGYRIDTSVVAILVGWFFLCAFGVIGDIANWAHGFGFATGAAWAFGETVLARVTRGW